MLIFIVIAITCIIGYFILLNIMKNYGIKKINEKTDIAVQILQKFVESDPGNPENVRYSKWLKENPANLWSRILVHTTKSNKKRGELAGKILLICESVNRLLQLDNIVNNAIKTGSIKFNNIFTNEVSDGLDIEEMRAGKLKLFSIIEQAFLDIKKELGITNPI